MCVYNGQEFLTEAVQSVLSQTFTSFEFIVVNDGSTDGSAAILLSFNDPRIRIIENVRNLGLIRSLNIGLEAARGELIARMDADDICVPERFAKQVDFLDRDPDIGLCGTWLQIIGEDQRYTFPLTHEEIKVALLEYNPIAHPSIMFRSRVIKEAGLTYDIDFPGAEDYELWTRAIFLTKFANIPEPLLFYRKHSQQVTQNKKDEVAATSGKIKIGLLKSLAICPGERESVIHSFLFNDQFKEYRTAAILEEADEWLYRIFSANRRVKQFDDGLFLALWKTKLFVTCIDRYDLKKWKQLKRSRLFKIANITMREKIKLVIKCLIRTKVR
jgi:glycosyltransferase involved in cell wall biosynthesis